VAMNHDVIVIGGGPAGSSAAITAARAGFKVLLLDAGKYPRHKVCGEFVSPESLDLLASLLGSGSELLLNAPRVSRSRVFIDDTALQFPLSPAAVSISRHDLDVALWNAAIQSGVDARQQTAVEDVSGRGPFVVRTTQTEFSAKCVIFAAGRWPRIERFRPGLQQGSRWIGLKAHFEETAPPLSTDLYFFEHGYCGVQPIGDGRVNACAMVRSDVATTLNEVFRKNAALAKRSRTWNQVFDTVSTSPLVFRQPIPVRDNILLAGDSAGFIDPFAGDGIALALRTGSLAAQGLAPFLQSRCSLDDACQRYARIYETDMLPIFRSAARLRFGLRLPRPIQRQAAKLLRMPSLANLVVRTTRGRIA
jgi:flavin-dependent dehydrogenase